MANVVSIARPYALAAFECARDQQQLPAWKAFLESAATMANEPTMLRLLDNPELAANLLFDLFHDVLSTLLDPGRNNFLLLLSQNKRFNVLPEITNEFNLYYAALEKVSHVRVITAVPTQDNFRDKLVKALSKRMQREITLHCEMDPTIIGGAIIHMGDRVIDGSISGKLTRLLESLTR